MPTTVGSHSVAAFVNPSNGDALDANVVKGNDNTLRAAYVTHDADAGVHFQSSVLASRPAAGVAGRKWLTTDDGPKLWYDTGSVWTEIGYVPTTGTAVVSALQVTGALEVDGTTLTVDATNNRVGVGTATPGVALDVVGTTRTSNGLTVTAGGLIVSAGGMAVTGNSTVTGTLGGLTGLTVASGGLTVTSGGVTVTGNSTITGTLGGLTGLTVASGGASISGTVTATTFSGSGASLTSLPSSALTGNLPALDGSALTNLTAGNLAGTLPAISGANLTSLNASNISSGTLNVARLPSPFTIGGIVISSNGSVQYNAASSGGTDAIVLGNANAVSAYLFQGANTISSFPDSPTAGSTFYWMRVNINGTAGYIPVVV
jgi:hypothetical protein